MISWKAKGSPWTAPPHPFKKLSYEILKTTVKAFKGTQERQQGEVVDTPPMPTQVITSSMPVDPEGETLTGMFEKWKVAEKRPLKTINEFGRHVRRFVEIHGDLPVTALTKRNVVTFKEMVAQLPARMKHKTRKLPVPKIIELFKDDMEIKRVSPAAVQKMMRAINAVLGYAVESGYIDFNPASGVKVKGVGKGRVKRSDYETHHLQTIFSSQVFTESYRPTGGAGEAAYWLPLLGLFTGARLEELAQLLVNDVKVVEGVNCFEIDTIGGDKKIKTDSSRRTVPIHSELVRLGFLEYVQWMRNAGERRVFPKVGSKRLKGETKSWPFSAWWGRYIHEELGIDDVAQPFHGFRHTFKTFCRASMVEKEYHDAITGHSTADVGDGYGSGHPVSVLAEKLEKLRYPGLEIEIILEN